MSYDPYRKGGYGSTSNGQGDMSAQAGGGANNQWNTRIQMPNAQDMGGTNPSMPPFVRSPYYPTAPFYSTDPNVGYQTRFYSTGIVYNTDYTTANSEVVRRVQFDLPCRLIAVNGAAIPLTVAGGDDINLTDMSGLDPRDFFLFRMEYTTGDQITVSPRLGSNVLGTNEGSQGELGGVGYTINAGGSLVIGLTPLYRNLRIDITLVCLEMRGASNFTRG
tara:strand:+ start:714 stop:1370 length:657 start_codon:yes stop_codon:yes gene_type:complete